MSALQVQAHRKPLLQQLTDQQDKMLQQIVELCQLNSGSYHFEGIGKVQASLEAIFAPLADSTEYRPLAPIQLVNDDTSVSEYQPNPMQIFRARPDAPLQLLMTGHSDTVFPKDTHFQDCRIDGGLLHGPGTADMKGGLVILAHALAYLNDSPLRDQFGFTVAISPDEEIGSTVSAPILMELAQHAHYGLTYEPALSDGTLAGARKGSGNFSVTAKGFSTHAGRDFFDGRNAVVAIAETAQRLSQLTDETAGITVNIGKIVGGGAVNVVPDQCLCRFNVRVNTPEQMTDMETKIQQTLSDVESSTGCTLTLHGHFNRPPKPMTPKQEAMFELLKSCGQELGLDIRWKATGGCCEGNNLAAAGLINIDTLGVRGANIHTDQEYACIDSFAERAALTVTLIEKLISLNADASKEQA